MLNDEPPVRLLQQVEQFGARFGEALAATLIEATEHEPDETRRVAIGTTALMMIKAFVNQIAERSGSAIASMWSLAALEALRARVPAIDQLARMHSAKPKGPAH